MSADKLDKIILFGAGQIGNEAIEYFGADKVAYFADNNRSIQGTEYCGKKVIDISEAKKLLSKGFVIVISVLNYGPVISQLELEGIKEYYIFRELIRKEFKHIPFKNSKTKLVNYSAFHPTDNEISFADRRKEQFANSQYDLIRSFVNSVKDNVPLFQYIEVETVNRCNGTCSFCPVNATIDKRERMVMSDDLFRSIVDQLAEFNYSGYFSPFSNNEPLLDKRLEKFLAYARKKLPNAWIYFYTNGTLFTAERLKNILDNVDEIIVDNYCTDGKLIEPCRMMVEEIEKHPQWAGKVHIDVRNREEVLLTRGGNSPNRSFMPDYGDFSCAYPFTQMVVRPDGKVSLCCNDARGEHTLGDLSKERILDVWYGKKYQAVREALAKGRKNYGNCAKCDSMEARYYTDNTNVAVSIIVPVYNVSRYLRRCLDSCVFQTLKNIEVIVINDCSPDPEDTAIMEEYGKKYPDRVRLVYLKENMRQGGARNVGIHLAKGNYVTFIDSDDYLGLNFCERCLNLAIKENADLVMTGFWLCRAGKEIMPIVRSDYIKDGKTKEKAAVYPCSLLVRKSLITQSDAFFPEHMFHEDTFTTPLWLLLSQRTSVIDEPLCHHFTEYKGSTTSSAFYTRGRDLFKAYDRLLTVTKNRYSEYYNVIVKFVLLDILNNRIREAVSPEETRLFVSCFHELLCKHEISAGCLDENGQRICNYFYRLDPEKDWVTLYRDYLSNVKRYYLLSCTPEDLAVLFKDRDPDTVCVWGCGLHGTELLTRFSATDYGCYATDMNSKKHGKVMPNGSIILPWNEIKDRVKTIIVAVDGKCADISAFVDKNIEIFAANG